VLIQETIAFGLVIGCALFGILWGIVNAILVKGTDMEEYLCFKPRVKEGDAA
jgi:hypothetical protein